MSNVASSLRAGPVRGSRRLGELVSHLALREIASAHRFTLLGWTWPLARQLVQLGVLVLVFSEVIEVGIAYFPAFVFSGLIAWSWFSTGVAGAAGVLVERRHLVFQPGFPAAALPAVAVAVPLIDLLIALPVLIGMLLLGPGLEPAALLFPVLIAIQATLMCGIAWLAAALTVFFRDVSHVVAVAVASLFYLTPVFYELSRVPEEYRWLLQLNPMTTLVEGYHSILIDGRVPAFGGIVAVAAVSLVVAVGGLAIFRRLEPRFVDEL